MSYLYGKPGPDLNPPPFTDMMGQEVRPGDMVAYAVRRGNTAEMKVAVVLETKWNEKMSGGYWEWKVKATHESGYGSSAVELTDSRPSSPTRGRAVRIAKGTNW
jgi:hypothetical protein